MEGHMSVKNLAETYSFYKRVFGMEQVHHHGYDILVLNGEHFFSIFEMSAEDAKEYDVQRINLARKLFRLQASFGCETEDEVKRMYQAILDEGGKGDPPAPRPWAACAIDVVDKYGVQWFISTPQKRPPEGCLACVPINEKPGCDFCIRWVEEDFICPKISQV